MHLFWEFLSSVNVIALLFAILVFIITILLVVRKSISFGMTFLLLLFCLLTGLVISNYDVLRNYIEECRQNRTVGTSEDHSNFKQQVLQAIEDLKVEVTFERNNLRKVATQVQEVFDQLDVQKQKLQQFIEETKGKLKTDSQTEKENEVNSLSSNPDS